MIIKVKIGDNANPHYSEIVYATINDDLWNKYKEVEDKYDDESWQKRNEYWDRICNAIDRQNALPLDWYVDKDFEECETI